ncbi:MAG: glutamine--fructose-6-phosphate aminotransferase [Omnitrophica WOR_2 bacterium RIFCSPLOWO2_12_FULL_50_9]|nr:MAG: glutamine--fructose-6-phosphate aminotransferase [Omnitrophica WOR_2 bacterium RIFCSPLOWO2_12_FULL_50_9]
MCGIIGYVGGRQAPPILLEGLKKLEYRGYDSSGIGIISRRDGKIVLQKTKGKIQDLQDLIRSHPLPESTIGISHTRWATHGVPNKVNAHPHADCTGKILLVHNGIIENFEELKRELRRKGHTFSSGTDTEVIVHLIEEYYRKDLLAAVRKAIARLKGAFAFGVISSDYPEALIAARVGSPLIIGLGKGENFIASDVPALLEYTKQIIYLKDEQIALVQKDKVQVLTFAGRLVQPKIDKVTFKVDAVRKQGYAHFMLKEIHEQPQVLREMLHKRLRGNAAYLEGLGLNDNRLRAVRHVVIVACGTAYHAGMVGKYVIESLSSVPVSVDVSSEFRYRNPIVDRNTLVMAISQSGETADTLAAVREAKAKGARVVSICNVLGSSLARESDGVLYTYAGPEIGVASTKAYTAQLCMLYLLAMKLAAVHKGLPRQKFLALRHHLGEIPLLYEGILKNKNTIVAVAKANSHFGCFLFLGRNINYPSALEGALKLKEISYIPAEGYAAGEMKHGPIALIDEYRAVVCVAPQSPTYEKMISNMQEIRARKGKIIAIATEGDKTIVRHAHQTIYVPATHELLTPLVVALPLQLLAYYIAVRLGCDVDQPRNLAKSVTVE